MLILSLLSLLGLAMADTEPSSSSSPSSPDWQDLLIGADLLALMGLAVVGSSSGNQREEVESGEEESERKYFNLFSSG